VAAVPVGAYTLAFLVKVGYCVRFRIIAWDVITLTSSDIATCLLFLGVMLAIAYWFGNPLFRMMRKDGIDLLSKPYLCRLLLFAVFLMLVLLFVRPPWRVFGFVFAALVVFLAEDVWDLCLAIKQCFKSMQFSNSTLEISRSRFGLFDEFGKRLGFDVVTPLVLAVLRKSSVTC